ncbi:MAG: hypothetical protein FWD99_01135 [Oscillospiraceae bacterium]|nr:hypothetical protein [Oscillospiraceae bacterium]
MSKYQKIKNAIEAFQPDGANVPILYSTTEVNEKGFNALTGRKLKLWSSRTTIAVVVCVIFLIAISAVATFLTGSGMASAPAAFVPLFIALLFRTTPIAIRDDGLDFYFLESRLDFKYVVSDKLSLPYDRISNVKMKTGSVFKNNRYFTFEFLHNDKKYRIKTSMSNKKRKMKEQEENLKYLLEVLEKKQIKSN